MRKIILTVAVAIFISAISFAQQTNQQEQQKKEEKKEMKKEEKKEPPKKERSGCTSSLGCLRTAQESE